MQIFRVLPLLVSLQLVANVFGFSPPPVWRALLASESSVPGFRCQVSAGRQRALCLRVTRSSSRAALPSCMVDRVAPLDTFKSFWQTAASGITSVLAPSGVQAAKMQRARDLSAQLKTLLLLGLRAKEFERTAIDAIISEITAIGSRVDPALLSSGPWQAVYTKNSQPLWEKQARYIPLVTNRAWQDYDLAGGRVVNVGQILGDKIWVSVEGAVSEQSVSDMTPKYYTANIEKGVLNIFGARLPLPIQGKGVAKLMYQDSNLRIFESPKESESEWEEEGLIVVQMPLDSIP